jgi:hypothetical protein
MLSNVYGGLANGFFSTANYLVCSATIWMRRAAAIWV